MSKGGKVAQQVFNLAFSRKHYYMSQGFKHDQVWV